MMILKLIWITICSDMRTSGTWLRIVLLLVATSSNTLAYNLCCPPDKHLDESKQFCISGPATLSSLLVNASSQVPKKLKCAAYETYPLDTVELQENDEEIRVQRYDDQIPSEDYCVDGDSIILCDRCQETGIECINLCCPFDYIVRRQIIAENDNTTENEQISNASAIPSVEYSCVRPRSPRLSLSAYYKLRNKSKGLDQLNGIRGQSYRLVGPIQTDENEHYPRPHDCPGKEIYLIQMDEAEKYFLDIQARLNIAFRNNYENVILEKDSYCVSYDQNQNVGFMYCSQPDDSVIPNQCEIVREYVFNTALVLSILGTILSLISHFLPSVSVRKTPFGRISIIYLMNILGQFICIAVERFGNFQPSTASCKAMLYFQQYFFQSFLLSLNALSYIVYRMIVAMDDSDPCFGCLDPEHKAFIYFSIVYVQGIPLIMVMITLGIDFTVKNNFQSGEHFNAVSYPGMAMYDNSCFMSYQKLNGSNRPNFFATPQFIYVQSFQIIIIFINSILFGMTVKAYTRNVIIPTDKNVWIFKLENTWTMARIFFYSVFVWILEMMAAGIAHKSVNESCPWRFVLDAPSTFFGMFIFYAMVVSRTAVRKEVIKSLISTFPN